ncbi:hypothetical protein [Streptomyces sp. NRRL WC-3744]|uniref:hypothetical protein n=1 Tax=Streptomyces sp. NRRL WC-3744 TaxID=1463935 RepID=UPI000AC29B27|nr:hypothetical protein [Streptomyces sp. NRRL WC-3744]
MTAAPGRGGYAWYASRSHCAKPQGRGITTSLTVDGPQLVLLAYAPLARLALHRLVQP